MSGTENFQLLFFVYVIIRNQQRIEVNLAFPHLPVANLRQSLWLDEEVHEEYYRQYQRVLPTPRHRCIKREAKCSLVSKRTGFFFFDWFLVSLIPDPNIRTRQTIHILLDFSDVNCSSSLNWHFVSEKDHSPLPRQENVIVISAVSVTYAPLTREMCLENLNFQSLYRILSPKHYTIPLVFD
jgi:hypothetical protein